MRTFRTIAVALVAALCTGGSALQAASYEVVSDRGVFLQRIEGHRLTISLMAIALIVHADGTISGTASDTLVTGRWDWRDGFFCREMAWGDTLIAMNCQLVEIEEGVRVRFTASQGQGDHAVFNIE